MNASLASLAPSGWSVLQQSHLVPVDVWLRSGSTLLHLRGRGTTLHLRRYAGSDLTVALLRAECDCASHREAGAAARVVLRPGAVPSAQAVYDGAARHGWTGLEAARLRGPALARVLDELLPLVAPAAPVDKTGSAGSTGLVGSAGSTGLAGSAGSTGLVGSAGSPGSPVGTAAGSAVAV